MLAPFLDQGFETSIGLLIFHRWGHRLPVVGRAGKRSEGCPVAPTVQSVTGKIKVPRRLGVECEWRAIHSR